MLNKILHSAFYRFADSGAPPPIPRNSLTMKVTKDIQRRIINELTKRGWSLSEFSEKIGMHRTYATKFLSQGATIKELNQGPKR